MKQRDIELVKEMYHMMVIQKRAQWAKLSDGSRVIILEPDS